MFLAVHAKNAAHDSAGTLARRSTWRLCVTGETRRRLNVMSWCAIVHTYSLRLLLQPVSGGARRMRRCGLAHHEHTNNSYHSPFLGFAGLILL